MQDVGPTCMYLHNYKDENIVTGKFGINSVDVPQSKDKFKLKWQHLQPSAR